MTPLLFVVVALAGGVGAAARFALDTWVKARLEASAGGAPALPVGTMLINVTGSFALGLVAGAAAASVLPAHWHAVLGTGLLGGYTTFSTASVETVRLLLDGRRPEAAWSGLGTLVIGVGAAALGWWVAAALA